MSLQSYVNGISKVVRDLKNHQTEKQYAPFLNAVSYDWQQRINACRLNEPELVEKVATAAPTRRDKILQKYPLEQQFWLLASATQLAMEAVEIVFAAHNYLTPGVSNRSMVSRAQRVREAPFRRPHYRWPFPLVFPPLEEFEAYGL